MAKSAGNRFKYCNHIGRARRRRFFLGRYLDARWDTQPILTIGLMLTGLVLGASYLVITLKEWMTDDKK